MNTLTAVSKTMLATLKSRYFASIDLNENFDDKKAEYLVSSLEIDAPVKESDLEFIQCVVERAKIFDLVISNIVKTENHISVVNLGCGLCTRLYRLRSLFKDLNYNWYNIDTSEVIEFRKTVLQEDIRVENLFVKNLENPDWITSIIKDDQTNVFIMEGFSMYVEKKTFTNFLKNIIDRTILINAKTILLFDYYHPNFQEYFLSNQYGVQLETKTGFKNLTEINHISNRINIKSTYDIFKKLNGFQQLMGRTNFKIKNNLEEPYNIVEINI